MRTADLEVGQFVAVRTKGTQCINKGVVLSLSREYDRGLSHGHIVLLKGRKGPALIAIMLLMPESKEYREGRRVTVPPYCAPRLVSAVLIVRPWHEHAELQAVVDAKAKAIADAERAKEQAISDRRRRLLHGAHAQACMTQDANYKRVPGVRMTLDELDMLVRRVKASRKWPLAPTPTEE